MLDRKVLGTGNALALDPSLDSANNAPLVGVDENGNRDGIESEIASETEQGPFIPIVAIR